MRVLASCDTTDHNLVLVDLPGSHADGSLYLSPPPCFFRTLTVAGSSKGVLPYYSNSSQSNPGFQGNGGAVSPQAQACFVCEFHSTCTTAHLSLTLALILRMGVRPRYSCYSLFACLPASMICVRDCNRAP